MTVPLYYQIPFGVSGDRTSIPVADPGDGSINYTEGFGPDYQLPRETDPAALTIPRAQFNEMVYDITANLQWLQQFGVPAWISSAANGGTPFPYAQNAQVLYTDGNVYVSLTASNTATPTNASFWAKAGSSAPFLNSTNAWTGANSFLDGGFSILNTATPTKVAKFDASALSSSTTRTYTLPNISSTLAVLGLQQTFTQIQTISAAGTGLILNSTDSTAAKLTFQDAGTTRGFVSAGANYALSAHLAAGTLVGGWDTSGNLRPNANATYALGTTALSWNGLFLAAATAINWNSGNATITHSTGALASNVPFTANSFIPSSSTVPTNGLYLPAANTLGWAINSAEKMQLAGSALSPAVTGGTDLGTTALMWGNLFLQSGGIINFNNGNATLTHSAGNITSNVPLTANGFIPSSSTIPVNGLYLTASNTPSIAANSALAASFTATVTTVPALAVNGSTAPANGIYLPSANSPTITANSNKVAQFLNNGSANYFELFNAATSGSPSLYVTGSDANVSMALGTKGTGQFFFYTNTDTSSALQFLIEETASAVNYGYVKGAATTQLVTFGAAGSDANVGLELVSQGTGSVFIGSSNLGQGLEVQSVANIFNYFRLTPTITGTSPSWNVIGSDTNINFLTVAKGTGVLVNQGSYTNSTTGTANVIISSAGQIQRTTSMRKYKTDIEDIDVDHALAITAALRPIWYRSIAPADVAAHPSWSHYSFIADEVAALDPRLAHYGEEPLDKFDENGQMYLGDVVPIGIQGERILTLMCVAFRKQITDLQAEVAALKSVQ